MGVYTYFFLPGEGISNRFMSQGLAIRVVLGDGAGGGEKGGVGRGGVNWSYSMDSSKENDVVSTSW